jgi:NAD(P)-dependent dehydrogenase (short-subunit alcohol dehydrogenase family)
MTTKPSALITGANRGLGFATAGDLAKLGFNVYLTARDANSGEAAAARIRAAQPRAQVQHLILDLTSFASIRACAEAFNQQSPSLDLLVLNAGLMAPQPNPVLTGEGFELTFATNHIGHFLLTHLLLDAVKAAAPSRIVVVSSAMHRKGLGMGPGPDFDWDNLKAEKSFHPVVAYRNSKLANLWFTRELAARLAPHNVTVTALSPGFVPATIAVKQKSALSRFMFRQVWARMPFARSIDQAVATIRHAATADLATGSYIEDCKLGIQSDEAKDAAQAARLWRESLTWCGIAQFGA